MDRAELAITKGELEGLGDLSQKTQANLEALALTQSHTHQRIQDLSRALNLLDATTDRSLRRLTRRLDTFQARADRFADKVVSAMKRAAKAAARKGLDRLLGRFLPSGSGPLLEAIAPALARGGIIRGPGGPREDRIPALLSNGEAVIPAASVARHRASVQALINGTFPPRLAKGGIVGTGAKTGSGASGAGAGGLSQNGAVYQNNVTVTLNSLVPSGPHLGLDSAMTSQVAKTIRRELEAMMDARIANATRPGNRLG